jgi:hypothetical protein
VRVLTGFSLLDRIAELVVLSHFELIRSGGGNGPVDATATNPLRCGAKSCSSIWKISSASKAIEALSFQKGLFFINLDLSGAEVASAGWCPLETVRAVSREEKVAA